MPFIASLGKRPCNDCRVIPPAGDRIYLGEHTGMVWCERCAELHLYRVPGDETPPPSRLTFPKTWQAFAPPNVRAWHERGEE